MTLTVACVRGGDKYSIDYVTRLRDMVKKFLPIPHEFICLTDQPEKAAHTRFVDTSCLDLPTWWGKMAIFDYSIAKGPILYLDLDTLILGDISELVPDQSEAFYTCRNFTQLQGHATWPCKYGSCISFLGEEFRAEVGHAIWERFWADRKEIMRKCKTHGDQLALEQLYPDAQFFQDYLRPDFFSHYKKEQLKEKPSNAAVIIFGGFPKPHQLKDVKWVQDAWSCK